MRITKVIYKKEKVTINSEELKNGEITKTTFECDDTPAPEFLKAMEKIGKNVAKQMAFPPDWSKSECRSVSINYEVEDDRRGIVVSLYVPLDNFNSGITVNTPHLREKLQGTAGGGAMMSPALVEQMEEVLAQAQSYLDGNRSQQSLLDKGEDQ